MRFAVYGGFELPRHNRLVASDAPAKRQFWDSVDTDVPSLSRACGCYVFAAQNRPWYVGLAASQSYAEECLTDHKIKIFNNVLNEYERAAPWLYFIAKLTPGKNFCSPSRNGHRDIQALENVLIGMAIARNPELYNIRGTKFLREMNVPGLLNTERGQANSYAVQEIRSLFGI